MKKRVLIRFTTGSLQGKKFSLGQGEFLIIGSHPQCGILLTDLAIAQQHACIYYTPKGKILFKDLGSQTGCYINGKKIKKARKLFLGDRVSIGAVAEFQYSWWNALQVSHITRATLYTALKREVRSTAYRTLAPKTPRKIVLMALLPAAALLTLLGWLNLRTPTIVMKKIAAFPAERALPKVEKMAWRRSLALPESRGEMNPADHFVWDEIVNISRRFGEPPPSAMDRQFVNQVKVWIERMTRNGGHKLMVVRRDKYWKEIEGALRSHNLPVELGYVAWVESGFDIHVANASGAVGLWQFLPDTAREYGLKVDANEDERLDPEKSSLAAARYFENLLRMFGAERYLLALASYNAGQYRVQRREIAAAVRRAKSADFWHLRDELPRETVEYVPKILAAIIIARNPDRW